MVQDIKKMIEEYALDPKNYDFFAQLLTRILPTYNEWCWGQPSIYKRYFPLWQRAGFNLTPNHYYSPLPSLPELSLSQINHLSSLLGIELRVEFQLQLLELFGRRYRNEYRVFNDELPNLEGRFYFGNGAFERVDAEVLYCMIRHFKPRQLVEIGAGYSTLVSAAACQVNLDEGAPCHFIAVEPFPNDLFKNHISGLSELRKCKLESIDLSLFTSLGENDIVFIDSSHVIKCGNDVEYEYLELIPRLRPGVVIHIHDIFVPLNYPESWLKEEFVFWNEQYLLQAFLAFNRIFETLWSGCYMHLNFPNLLTEAFTGYNHRKVLPGSYWIRRCC